MSTVSWSLTRAFVVTLLFAVTARASITGTISGVVADSSGAVVSGATVVAVNTQTGVKAVLATNTKGFYNFAALPVGTYDVEASQTGFKTFKQTGLRVDANSALRVDAILQVGTINEKVEVTSSAVHVETESTQMGEVISSETITAVPLNGRAYTDLLALQPGVSPYNSTDTDMTGVNDRPVDGGLNSGNPSVNGQREAANGFMVNGSNVEEGKTNGAAIIPNLDSISEFRIITNNFDAEYGNYSGGQVNVVTKSGTNAFHGSGFEFLRNTALDAKNYFALSTDKTPVFRQNQFGGTFGGPVKRDETFFFFDYQGTPYYYTASTIEPTTIDPNAGIGTPYGSDCTGQTQTRREVVPLSRADADDPGEVVRRVGRALASEPVDIAFLGIGENGHIAFNDPPANFDTVEPYIIVDLDEACRLQQVGEAWFADISQVPRQISMSVRQILRAKEIVAVVPDSRKAQALKLCFESEISPRAPASILRTHPNATVYLDKNSVSLLSANLQDHSTDGLAVAVNY